MNKIQTTPCYLLNALRQNVEEIYSFKYGLTNKQFIRLCQDDEVFRKNLLLLIKDITIVSTQLINSLSNAEKR